MQFNLLRFLARRLGGTAPLIALVIAPMHSPAAASAVYSLSIRDCFVTGTLPSRPCVYSNPEDFGGGRPDGPLFTTFSATSSNFNGLDLIATATLSGYARSNPGSVGISLIADHLVGPGGISQSAAEIIVQVSDTLTVGGDLPVGTPVRLEGFHEFRFIRDTSFVDGFRSVSSDINATLSYVVSGSGSRGSSTYEVPFFGGSQVGTLLERFVFDAVVGDTISLFQQFDFVQSSLYRHDGDSSSGIRGGSISLDGGRSSHAYLDAITPGVMLTSSSGHNYSVAAAEVSPVPEPATHLLVLFGIGLIIRRVANRK